MILVGLLFVALVIEKCPHFLQNDGIRRDQTKQLEVPFDSLVHVAHQLIQIGDLVKDRRQGSVTQFYLFALSRTKNQLKIQQTFPNVWWWSPGRVLVHDFSRWFAAWRIFPMLPHRVRVSCCKGRDCRALPRKKHRCPTPPCKAPLPFLFSPSPVTKFCWLFITIKDQ